MRRVLLIANPTSGGGKVPRLLPQVRERLSALGVEHRTETTRDLAHARELTLEALALGEIPVAFSGDGVAGAVAGAAAYRDAVIGVLPGGSGNDFCRHAGIPGDALAACETLARGEPRPIDLGEANGVPFLGIASLGFDSEANAAANAAPRALGRAIYVYGALSALARWRPASFEVEADGERLAFEGWSVICANTSVYGGGMFVAPDARIDDGLLDLVAIRKTGRARFLASFPKVFKGEHVRLEHVTVRRAPEIRVSASRPFTVFADGDPIADLPVVVRALPAAVRVLLPG
ncbi:MAG: diacylglycerol kinase family lipid kinase [Solirubrobacteraceae bacterium]|nr:diacylglycerol kinase family lipid kinase [Solirubrobacteraceae bacterium]